MDRNNRPHLETSLIGRYVRPVFLCVRRANLGSKNKVSEMRNRTGNDDRLELRPAEFTGPWQGHCQKTAMTCHRLPRSAMACHALPVVEGSWPRPAVVRRTPTIGGVNRNKIDRRLLGRIYERDLTRFGSGLSDLFTRKGRRRPSRACHRLPHRSKRLSRTAMQGKAARLTPSRPWYKVFLCWSRSVVARQHIPFVVQVVDQLP